MARSSKKINVSGGTRPGSPRPAETLRSPSAAGPVGRYLVLRQLAGKVVRLNLGSVRLNIYRAAPTASEM